MFLTLNPEVDCCHRFGAARRYPAGAPLFVTGEISPGMFLLIAGSVAVMRHEGRDRVVPIVDLGPGNFCGRMQDVWLDK
jgi:thioredoxin reductase (NADPH)